MESDELVLRVRELAAADPAAAQKVEQVVADAIAALEKATGTPFGGGFGQPPVQVGELEAEADRQRAARADRHR
jgi:hypothetical protein